MTQQVVNGYNEVRRPNGDVALTDVFEHIITGKQNCIVDKTYYDVGDLLAKGRTFTPLVAMTPERVEALKMVLYDEPTLGDIETVEEMLIEAGAGNELEATE